MQFDANKAAAILNAALSGFPQALAAVKTIQAIGEAGADPTPEQWAEFDAAADAAADRLNATS